MQYIWLGITVLNCNVYYTAKLVSGRKQTSFLLYSQIHTYYTAAFECVCSSQYCYYTSFLQGKGARTSNCASEKTSTTQETSKTTSSDTKVSPGTKRPAAGGKAKGSRGGKKAKRKDIKEEEESSVKSGGPRPKNSKRRTVASKVSYKEESHSEGGEGLSDEEEFQVTSDEDSEDSESEAESTKKEKGRGKTKVIKNKNTAVGGGGKKRVKDEGDNEREEGEDDGGVEEGTTNNYAKRRRGKKEEGPGADEWLEVYLEKTSSWVCVHVEHGVAMPHLCSRSATAPVTYVVSVDGDGFVKDLGRKYDPTWMTSSRKRRVDEDWWDETLQPFLGPEDEKDKREEKEVRQTDLFNAHVCKLGGIRSLHYLSFYHLKA